MAIHSATDSCYQWDDYGAIVGARFDGHPWTQTVDLEVVERDHPATRHLGGTWRWHDEVYQFRDLRPDARVLLRAPAMLLDLDVPGANRPAFGFPLAWCFEEQQVASRRRASVTSRCVGEPSVPPAPVRQPRVGARRRIAGLDTRVSR